MKKYLLTVITCLFTSSAVQAHDGGLTGLLQHPLHHQQLPVMFMTAIVIVALVCLIYKSGARKP